MQTRGSLTCGYGNNQEFDLQQSGSCHHGKCMPKVLMVASEATPFAKTGGLADVIGSLPAALQAIGTEVAVLLPRYRGAAIEGGRRIYDHLPVWLGGTLYDSS